MRNYHDLSGALRGVIEAERVFEMILFGAYYKYSSTGTLPI